MGERDIRDKLLRVCGRLDQLAGRVGPAGRASAVLAPLMLGAGMAMLACDGDVETTGDGGAGGTTATTTTLTGTSTVYGVGGGQVPPYGVGGWGGSTSEYGVAGAPPPYGVGGSGGWGGSTSETGGGGGQVPPYGVGGWGGSDSLYGVGGNGN
jgi:hypothetical protein